MDDLARSFSSAFQTIKITLCYDGTPFVGWQRQANGVSVQGLLEDALGRFAGEPIPVIGAGRTDAGVHALGQVASARVPDRPDLDVVLPRALNAMLPEEVRVLRVEVLPAGFNARYAAREKTYRYRIVNSDLMPPFERFYAWHVTGPLDPDLMRSSASALVGTHDFAAFQGAGSGVATTRRAITRSSLEARVALPGAGPGSCLLEYEVTGDGFLRHMVRTIVGTLVEIGSGRWAPDRMMRVLESRDRRQAGPTAPAHGLFLVSVQY
jgi:tRNA pseudouridine38-40 synthase